MNSLRQSRSSSLARAVIALALTAVTSETGEIAAEVRFPTAAPSTPYAITQERS